MKPEIVDMVVLCGGRGSRLGSLTEELPKPLLPIGGSPFLLRLLLQWRAEGIKRFILSTHYLTQYFRDFVEEYASQIGDVDILEETSPLGTGGGLKFAVSAVKTKTFLVANGDSYVSENLAHVLSAHQKGSLPFTLTAIPKKNVLGGKRQKGGLKFDEKFRLEKFSTGEDLAEDWVNGGLYAMDLSEIRQWPEGKYDLEKQILPDTARHSVGVLPSDGKLLDIGVPECYSLFDQQLGPIKNLFSKI